LGSEYRSFTIFLADQGIIHRCIFPHTHHQNGIVERSITSLLSWALYSYIMPLPLKFWDYAFVTAVYLINRIPTSFLHFAIPNSILFHNSPNYIFLKTLGVLVFLLRPNHTHKQTLQDTAWQVAMQHNMMP